MKKLLTVILLVCLATSVFAAVDMRMRIVSSTYGANPGDPEDVTVAIDLRSTDDLVVYRFKGSFDVGDTLQAYLTGQSKTDGTFLSAGSGYTVTTSVSGGIAKYKYQATAPGSGATLTANTWQEIIQFTFNWNYVSSSTLADFAWNDDDDGYLFNVEIYLAFGINIPISVTGGRQSPSAAGLTDYSLPVLLSAFDVDYSYENGSLVTWTCGSQQNCEQFILKRSTDGINWEEVYRVEGGHTVTSTLSYEYCDETAEAGKTYVYRLFEVIEGTSGPNAIALIPVQTLAAPTQFNLRQNFPNPFNPDTHIPFEIINDSHVSLKVYNLLGQEVTTLIDRDMKAGIYESDFKWDGTNQSGIQVPSGIYLYKLKAGDNVQIRKMTKLQ